MQLRSHVAVAVLQASGYSSDWTPSLGTSICRWCGPKKTKKIITIIIIIKNPKHQGKGKREVKCVWKLEK